jgi:stage III sporulation protein AD
VSILSVCIIGIAAAVAALSLRRHNPEISMLLAGAGCILIFASVLINLTSLYDLIKEILAQADINISYITVLLKALGICFLTEFACDMCIDSGQRALAGNISLAGRILIITSAIPLYKDVLSTVLSLSGGAG